MEREESDYIGKRLSFSSSTCTIRYIGEVNGTKGTWLGVEWDDFTAGKHAGEHNGTKLFECRSESPTAASFVRPNRPRDHARGFLEAVRSKYAPHDLATSSPQRSSKTEDRILISGKVVEEVGFDKIAAQQALLQELKIVVVDSMAIAGICSRPWEGNSSTRPEHDSWRHERKLLAETCPKIEELDMGRNLLESWVDAMHICKALPRLRRLVLNGNRFRSLSGIEWEPETATRSFSGITELRLDGTLLEWSEVTKITACFPHLRTLSLASNQLGSLTSPLDAPGLTTINLSFNPFGTLSATQGLSSLPDLSTLILRSTHLSTLTTLNPPFTSVTTLDLSHNDLASIDSICSLPSSFPSLRSLRVTGNPYFTAAPRDTASSTTTPVSQPISAADTSTVHILTLARLPTLTELNYAAISSRERENAELYYLSSVARELADLPDDGDSAIAPAAAESAALARHPRWGELGEQYGVPEVVRRGRNETKPGTLGARLLKLEIKLGAIVRGLKTVGGTSGEGGSLPAGSGLEARDPGIERTGSPIELLVPRTINTYRLKSVVATRLGLPSNGMKLVWETDEWDPPALEKDEDLWSVPSESGGGGDEDGEDQEKEKDGLEDPTVNGGRQGPTERNGHGKILFGAVDSKSTTPQKEGWVRREVELIESTRPLGFWIEEARARIRVEVEMEVGPGEKQRFVS